MAKEFKLYLTSIAFGLLIISSIYISAVDKLIDKETNRKNWVRYALDYKEYRAENTKGDRIIIASGSNSLFGMESPILEQFTGRQVVNMAIHAHLELDFVYYMLRRHLRKGDVLVMPLEFEYYKEEEFSRWFGENMVDWGKRYYVDYLPTTDYLAMIAKVPKSHILQRWQTIDKNRKAKSKETVIKEILHRNKTKPISALFAGYSHESLTLHGDMLTQMEPIDLVKDIVRDGDDYSTSPSELSSRFLKNFKMISKLAEEREARLILTWPVTIRNPGFDMGNKEHQENIKYFTEQLAKEDIHIQCEPGLFNIKYTMFSNTSYHMNWKGARLRSIVLGDCIRTILSGDEIKDLKDDDVVSKLKEIEGQFEQLKYPLPR